MSSSPDHASARPEDGLFEIPEAAALAGWWSTPRAQARVKEMWPIGDAVIVVIETNGPSRVHHDYVQCRQIGDGRWCEDYELYESPEEAALSTWIGVRGAHPQVSQVAVEGSEATVVINDAGTVNGKNQDWNYCSKVASGLWVANGSTG